MKSAILHFRIDAPPGTSSANEKNIATGSKKKSTADEVKPDVATTLYIMSNCEACDVVHGLLVTYGANFSEVNVGTDIELQIQLKEKINAEGSLILPTTIIGEEVIIGYDRQKLITTLETAGYNMPDTSDETNQ